VVKVVGLEELHFVGIYTSNTNGTRLAFHEAACLPKLVETDLFKEDDT
jgi:hypothetical protein